MAPEPTVNQDLCCDALNLQRLEPRSNALGIFPGFREWGSEVPAVRKLKLSKVCAFCLPQFVGRFGTELAGFDSHQTCGSTLSGSTFRHFILN